MHRETERRAISREAALASLLGNRKVLEAWTSKPQESERPKVKEAESVRLPDFPSPETYRSWKFPCVRLFVWHLISPMRRLSGC